MDLEDFDKEKFLVVGLSFGCPLLVILIAWFLILHIQFHWRPFLLARVVIAHTIKKPPKSALTGFVVILWWIFFMLPFLGFIAFGVTTALLFEPEVLGFIIAIAPTTILIVLYLFFDYNNRGYVMTVLSKILFAILLIVVIALTFADAYLIKPRSWMGTAYCFTFPPLLLFLIAYMFSHLRIPNNVIKKAIADEHSLDNFVTSLAEHNKKCFIGSKKLNIWWSLAIVVFSFGINFCFVIDFWKFKAENPSSTNSTEINNSQMFSYSLLNKNHLNIHDSNSNNNDSNTQISKDKCYNNNINDENQIDDPHINDKNKEAGYYNNNNNNFNDVVFYNETTNTTDGKDNDDSVYKYRNPTLYTAIGFFIVDFIIFLCQCGSKMKPSFFSIIFFGYLVKICSITFTEKYWISGHGIMYFVLSSFLLIRFFNGIFKPSAWNLIPNEHANELIDGLNGLIQKNRKIPICTVIMTLISWLLLTAALVVEIVLQYPNKLEFHPLPFEMSQLEATIGLSYMSIPFSLMIIACLYLYYDQGMITAKTGVLYLLSAISLVVFDALWEGMNSIFLLRLFLPLIFFFVSGCLTLLILLYSSNMKLVSSTVYRVYTHYNYGSNNEESYADDDEDSEAKSCCSRNCGRGCCCCKVNRISITFVCFLLLTIIDVALTIILPFVFKDQTKVDGIPSSGIIADGRSRIIGLMIILCLLCIICFMFFSLSYFTLNSFCNLSTFFCFLFTLIFLVGFCCCFGSVLNGVIIFCSFLVVFCLVFSLLFTKNNRWSFTLAPYLIAAIPSFIVTALAVAALFLIDLEFLFAILAFCFSFIFFGTSLFFWLQRKNFFFSFPAGASLFMLVAFSIATIVFIAINIKETFIVVSSVLFVIFVICFLGILCFVASQSTTNVIVFSNNFFPIRRLVEGKIRTLTIFNILYALTFCAPWFWGLFATIFFERGNDYGPLATSSAIFVVSFMTFYFVTKFDFLTFSAISYIQIDVIKHAISTAMEATNHHFNMVEANKPEKIDYEEYIEYINNKVNGRKDFSLFFSSVKAQLFVSSEVAFNSARLEVHNFFKNKINIDEEVIEFLEKNENHWSTGEKLSIFALLVKIQSSNPEMQQELDYENYVLQQEENRQNIELPKSIDNKKYQEIIRKLSGDSKFVDKEFGGSKKSETLTKNSTWKRMEDVYHSPMFKDTSFNPNMIKQGQLGDCYFVSALVAISRSPEYVSQIFSDPINNEKGVRCVNFHIMGQIVPVIVDTFIPFNSSGTNGVPNFCRPVTLDDQWWFSIVEKAYAKQYGSYQAIDGGNSHVALYRLTGGYPLMYSFHDMKTKEMIANGTFWTLMLLWHQQGHFMCAGSIAGKDTQKNKNNIVLGHAYTILRVIEAYGNKMVQLRNTWGDTEWSGDWGDHSRKWTTKMKKALDFKEGNDGVFWMCFKDFTLNYQTFYACIHPNMKYLRRYEIDGKFESGSKDGAKPTDQSNDASNLPQWLVRCVVSSSRKVNLKCFFEKNGGRVQCNVCMVYNGGQPLKLLYRGIKHKMEGVAPTTTLSSFEWTIDDTSKPVTLLFFRNKFNQKTNWHFEMYSDADLEITPINKK